MSMSLKKKVRELTGDDATQASQITALQTAVGDKDSGLVKAVADLTTAIGDNTTGEESGIYKAIADILAAIGDPADPASGTILYRLYQLEHPPAQSGTE